jgi:Fur family transcriptional regulator, zinc uptake regulator
MSKNHDTHNDHYHGHHHSHDHDGNQAGRAKLTKNQDLVLAALNKSASPMSAYSLLDSLRGDGFRAPLQVYRALEKLIEHGLVHRLESLSAFVACQHKGCDFDGGAVFAICETCGRVDEMQDSEVSTAIQHFSERGAFRVKHSVVELRGTCAQCVAA